MEVTPITSAHYPLVRAWLEARGMKQPEDSYFPKAALISYEGPLPVGAIFLRQVEGGIGMIDGLVTNPEAPGPLRHESNDLLTSEIFKVAKSLGIKSILAWSEDKNTLVRALETHGFTYSPGLILLKDL